MRTYAVKVKNNLLDVNNMLEVLGKIGITKLLVEGGPTLINSFLNKNLINEIYIYTSNKSLDNLYVVESPVISDDWEIFNENQFENDSLKIMRKKNYVYRTSRGFRKSK